MSDCVWSHRRQPTRLPRPWDSPSKNTGVGCHYLLQCMKVKSESEVAQSCLTLSDLIGDYTLYQNMGIMTNTHCLNMYILYLCGVCIIYSFCVSPPSRPILCSSPSLASAGWSLQTISSRFPSNGLHLDLANGKHQEDSQRARGEREGRYVFAALQLCAMVLPGTASLEDHGSSSAVLSPWCQHSLAIPMLPLFLLPQYDLLLYSTLPTSVQRATLLTALHLHYLSRILSSAGTLLLLSH